VLARTQELSAPMRILIESLARIAYQEMLEKQDSGTPGHTDDSSITQKAMK
jgi:hypothetical protein